MSLDLSLSTGPCEHCGSAGQVVFDRNITHNLTTMATACGLYKPLWRPYEATEKGHQVMAIDLREQVEQGLESLKSTPEAYRKYSPENGWGSYESLVEFAEEFLQAIKEYPYTYPQAYV